MSQHPAFVRLVEALRRARTGLRGGHVVALSAVTVMAFGLVGLRTVELPGPRPVTDGDRLRIEVVHPVEPEIVPGTVMDVGELVDGFQGLPPQRPSLMDMLWSYDDGWDEIWEPPPPPPPQPRRPAEAHYPKPAPRPPARALQRWFGFDAPRRDFQAERAARRARLEAREQRDRERRDWERRRHQRAELDRYAREGWRPVPGAWRELGRRDEPREDDWRGEPGRDDFPDPGRPSPPDDDPDPHGRNHAGDDSMVGFDE